MVRWLVGLVGAVAMTMAACGGATQPSPAPVVTKPSPSVEPTPIVKPTPVVDPQPDPDPLPPPDPATLEQNQKEAICHELFDHVFELIRHNNKMPIKPQQFDKMRGQGMKMCVQKITRKIADCVLASTTMQDIQKCVRP